MSESLNRALDEKIVVTETGKALTKLGAFVQSTLNRVLQGDAKAIPALVRLLNQTEQFKPIPKPGQMTGVVVMPRNILKSLPRSITGSFIGATAAQFQFTVHPIDPMNLGDWLND